MSIIIRLQRLSWSASAADVREFFRGLIIPEGGVHIVGGREGDAFIAFSSDEDARLAMRHDGKRLKDQKIKLLLSSRQEMQKVIEKARGDFSSTQNNDSTPDDDGSRRKRRLSVSRSRSGSREREANRSNNFNRSRSRSPINDRSRDKDTFVQQMPQKPSVPISGFSSFPTSFKQQTAPSMIPFDQGVLPINDPNLGFLDRVPPPMPPPFKVASGMLDRNLDSSMINERKYSNYPPPSQDQKNFPQMPMMLNEMAFAAGSATAPPQNIDFDGRGPNFHQDKFNQFSTNNNNQMQQGSFPISAPIVQNLTPQLNVPIRNRRALLPEPDEIPPTSMNDNSAMINDAQPFYRSRPEDVMYKAMLDRQQQQPVEISNYRNISDVQHQMFQNEPGFYSNRDVEQFYRGPPPIDSFDSSVNAPYNNHLDRNSASLGFCVCIDNAPPPMVRYGEVRYFFHPMRLDGSDSIKIVADEHGEKTGRIYCRFSTPTDVEAALSMDRRNNVRIRPCTDEEYDAAVDGCRSSDFNNRSTSASWNDADSSDRTRMSSAVYYKERTQRSNNLPWDVVDGRYVVELSNIPYKTDDQTVWDVVGDLRPVSLKRKMKYQNSITLQSDTAYVEFNNEADADMALTYGGRYIGGRPVNIRKSSVHVVEEFETRFFIPAGRRSPQYPRDYRDRDRDRNQRDRDRDYDSRDRDYDRDRDRTKDDGRSDGGRSKDVDIRDEQREKDRDREKRSGKEKSIEKKERSKDREKERSSSTISPQQHDRSANDRSKNLNASSSSSSSSSTSTSVEKHTCIMMSGLPPNIQARDIVSFFQGLRFAHGGIRLMREPRGTAYVEFCSTRDCEQAMLKNREYIGVQVVTLRTCSKSELTEAVQKQHGIGQQQTSGGDLSAKPVASPDETKYEPRSNKPKQETSPPVEPNNYNSMRSTKKDEPLTPIGDQNFNTHRSSASNTSQQDQRSSGFKTSQQDQRSLASNASQQQRSSSTNVSQQNTNRAPFPTGNIKPTAHIVPTAIQQQNNSRTVNSSSMTPNGQQQAQFSNPSMVNIHEPPPSIVQQPRVPDVDNSVVGDLGLSGYVCFLHNLPPKVTLEEICAMFQNEQMIDDSVRMHYSSNTGEPTGDCLLAFVTKQDAERACAKINGKNIFGRSLQMWVVSQTG